MIFLGIETSCDETGVALYNSKKKIIINETKIQIGINKKYGGVVPEFSSRYHNEKLMKLILLVLKKSKLSIKDIDVIGYTRGPGLIGPLLVGTAFSKALSYSMRIPSIGINHLEAHILLPLLFYKNLKFPFISLLISGSHTMIIKVISLNKYYIIKNMLDDSVGEVFDKISRKLKLKNYNGKNIEIEAAKNKKYFFLNYPKTLHKTGFSFSGLKTHIIKNLNNKLNKKNIAYNFQNTVIKIISEKCKSVLKNTNINKFVIGGGVSANKQLRKELKIITESLNINLFMPPIKYATDNGLMIAFLAYLKYEYENIDENFHIDPYSNIFNI